MTSVATLRAVKATHTVIWAFFAGCILAVPVFTFVGQTAVSAGLIAVVAGEVLVLAFNRMRCPLTEVAARYTEERQDNFDIYLPLWIARHNKLLFGALYLAGALYTLLAWLAA